jgi:hypothetical protein
MRPAAANHGSGGASPYPKSAFILQLFFGYRGNLRHKAKRMTYPVPHLGRAAFMIKYGYSADLGPEQISQEFRARYDYAGELQRRNASWHRILMVIEGMPEESTEEDAFWERVMRKHRLEILCRHHGLSLIEGDMLAEEYIARLETRWIEHASFRDGSQN